MNLQTESGRLVPKACTDLFTSIGVVGAPRAAPDLKKVLARPERYAAGVIDFSSDALSGKLVLASSFDFFASSRPASAPRVLLRPESAADWLLVRDWSMELANQLLGRIKNRLCSMGVFVNARPPKAVSGHSLLVTLRERKGASLAFGGHDHEVLIWFEATSNDSLRRGPGVEPIGEGQIVNF
jgi:hypothetical protein